LKKMIRSMTGYGRAEALLDGRKWTIEVKSLNHRYTEVFVRMPSSMSGLEGEVKRKVGEKLARGRIEVFIRMESEAAQEGEMRCDLNLPLLRHYHALLVQLRETLNLRDDISVGMLTGLKDAFIVKEAEVDLEAVWKGMEAVLEEALRALTEMRKKEGEIISRDMLMRVDLIKKGLNVIEGRAPKVVEEYHRKLSERVKELTGGIEIEGARLSQEVAIMADRMDITEEVVRFRSHLNQLDEMLAGDEAAGRKIDFLLQEMNREANTMGSKGNDAEISCRVVEIKSELSRMREQVQNIE
jgi:uncharacterized protein (TIGR00255 family)